MPGIPNGQPRRHLPGTQKSKSARTHLRRGVPIYRNTDVPSSREIATRHADWAHFLPHSIGPELGRVFLFGTQRHAWSLANSEIFRAGAGWRMDVHGAPDRPAPGVRCPRGAWGGYLLPCVYAIPPNKPDGSYRRTRKVLSDLLGAACFRGLIPAMGFSGASVNAFRKIRHKSRVAGCISQPGKSLYRNAQALGLSGRYTEGEEICRRVKSPSALSTVMF